MKRKFTLLIAALALLTMMASTGRMWGQTREDLVLTFSLTSNPGGWPTANSTTLTNYTYTLNTVEYTFALKNVKCNSGYLMLTQPAVLGVPAIEGYKLTKIVASNSSGCSTSTKVGISSSASSPSYIGGGEIQTWSTQSSSYTYTLTSTAANTMYYIYVTNKNAQIISLALTYAPVGGGSDPSISADDVDIAYDVTSESIVYEIENYVAGTMAANTTADWISDFTYQQADEIGEVGFTTTVNESISPRSATVTLTYTYGAKSTVNKDVTVTQDGNPNAPGSQNDPYTVAEARAAIDAGTGTQGVYATGIVSEIVTEYSSQFNNISYNISSDGLTASDQLQIFRGACSGVDEVRVGDIVVVSGNLTKYGDTYEFAQGSTLSSLKLVAPTFYPEAGAVASGTALTISDLHTGATIYYTTDGTNPTTGSTPYDSENKPTITAATTFKAIAVKDNYTTSDVASAAYTLLAPAATPTFSPEAGTYTWAQNVTISTTTEGATIYYTTDGSNPTSSSSVYSEPIAVNETKTIKAIAAKDGMANSDVAEATYTMNIPAINAENVNLAYDATAGSIAYTMTNPVDGGVLTAAITGGNEGTWLTLGDVSGEAVALTCSANDGDADRSATVTLTYTYNTDKTVTKVVTVTQAHFVVDYATLPFEWAGGSSADFAALNGVTLSGNGSDYGSTNAPYLIKFDSDNDYIMVKTDSQPAKVNIGVKMIGGASTSTITVKASTDGETFDYGEELTISGKQNDVLNLETTRTFDADVRYVKMVFTKGSNVGVGPITITKYTTDPIINAEDVDLACDATSGEIAYTITNPATGVSLGATTTADWISNVTITEEKVTFTTTANESTTARTATFTLTYTGAENKTVTVTQGAIDYATIPFAFDGGKADIENTRGLTENGLDSDYSSSPKLKFNTTGDWVVLKLNAAPISLSYDIKGNSFSGSTFTVQTSEDGVTYVDLATYTKLGDTQSITHINLATTVRYIKWVYTEKSNGNVALGNIHASNEYDTYGDVTIDSDALATHSVTVHSGSVVTFVGTNTNADKLVIEDGGQLIVNNSVAATVEKTIQASGSWSSKDGGVDGWDLISSPIGTVNTAEVTNLTPAPVGTALQYDLYSYNEASKTWYNQQGTEHPFTQLMVGEGYLYSRKENADLGFAGEVSSASITKTLTYTEANGTLAGWNLVGNPYTHNITWANLEPTNVVTTGYYTLGYDGQWSAEPSTTTVIKPMQGFLVKANAIGANIVFNNTASSKSRANDDYIKFIVANSQYEDAAYAMFSENAGLDKINHRNADIPMVYIPQNGQNYAIATMDDNTQAFELNFKAMTTGQYTLSYKAEGKYSYLHVIDRLTGEDIDMLLDGEYSFIGSPRDNEARFIVKLSYNANIDEIEANDIFAYQNGSDIIVNGNGELQVFDATGRMVMNTQVNGIQTVNIPATGMYIFRMVGDEVKTQKIVVR